MTPAEETRLRAVEERAKRAIDFHFQGAEWTCKQFKRTLNLIAGMAIVQIIEMLLIIALMRKA